MNYNVHHPNKSLNILRQEWELIYNIPIKYQLFYDKSMNFINPPFNNNKSIRRIRKYNRNYFLFDKRNIIIISNNNLNPRIMKILINDKIKTNFKEIKKIKINDQNNNNNNNNNKLKDHNLVLLQYFDVLQQKLFIIQILLIHKDITGETMTNYIKHTFILTCNQQKIWYNKIENILKSNTSSLKLYGGNSKFRSRRNQYLCSYG